MTLRIEDYALIGDCQAAALVGRNGSIDWLCWPSFDSPACFAALLGTPQHGRWKISPTGESKVRRRYRPDTLILETEFETAEDAATLHCRGARARRASSSSGCSASPTTSVCSPSSTTQGRSASLAIFRRPFRTSRSSTLRST